MRDFKWVADELRRLAPNAATPPGGTSHDGRRRFQEAAAVLEDLGCPRCVTLDLMLTEAEEALDASHSHTKQTWENTLLRAHRSPPKRLEGPVAGHASDSTPRTG